MKKRSFQRNSSGQVLIVSALLVALLLLSTALYVIEVGKDVPKVNENDGNVFSGYNQQAKATLISALSNATAGGAPTVLADDLEELKAAILSNSYQAMLSLDFSALNFGNYQNGLWISRGGNGQGVSSAYATFAFNASNPTAASDIEYAVNITSKVAFTGNYQQIDDQTKQVNLAVNVLNEGKPALAQNFALSYQNNSDWVTVDSPAISSHNNGTYAIAFNAQTSQQNEPLLVSLAVTDGRGILVGANLTCTNT